MNDSNINWINDTWSKIEQKMSIVADSVGERIPFKAESNVYDDFGNKNISWWTNGFWPGIMWLMYSATDNEKYRSYAENVEKKMDECFKMHEKLHHDVGFMWHISSGANYKLTKNPESKNRSMLAASTLASRYNANGGFIRAWNDEGTEGWTIIDCMMNLPLLYWASEETGDPRFKMIAMNHADKSVKYHIRPDGSVVHVVNYDILTGDFVSYPHTQGYDASCSSWSRGQAWAVYGYALSYKYAGKQEYLDIAKKTAHYFISAVACTDYVPLCDFRQPAEPVVYDTSAGAITACGLIEIANHVPEYEKEMYLNAALKILMALDKNHCNWYNSCESILQNSTGWYKGDRHIAYVFGDYYFIEALYMLKGFNPLFW